MRRLQSFSAAGQNPAGTASLQSADRKGSTIVVVIALLLALTFLGIVGYTIGTQEHGNAEYFSDAAKNVEYGVSRDVLFDWALRQVILGPRNPDQFSPGDMQSTLHGGHTGLLATLFGGDLTPNTGNGVNLYMDATGDIFVDQNRDTIEDPGSDYLLDLKRAPFAFGPGSYTLPQGDPTAFPAPDVDYNYWDINSPYLAYVNDGHLVASGGGTRKVVIPSFHRPQYLRSLWRSDGINPVDWYTAPETWRRVLRPHAMDLAVAANGTVTSTPRFIRTAAEATALQVGSGPFPFLSDPNAQANNLDMNPNNDGVWDGIWSGGAGQDTLVEYDADPDGDGTREAIWLDLGFPMQVRENADGTVTKFVPMFGITIYDADALLNLNAHGNASGLDSPADSSGAPLGSIFTNASGSPFGNQIVGLGLNGVYDQGGGDDVTDTRFISRSNQGARVSEVNPQWGLYATLADGPLDQHERFLGQYGRNPVTSPLSQTEMANLEWWWLMAGRPELDSTLAVQDLHAGRYGEVEVMNSAFTGGSGPLGYPGPGSTFLGTPTPGSFPVFPLIDTRDDNFNAYRGFNVSVPNGVFFEGNTNPFYNANYRVFPGVMTFNAWRSPLDLRGRGRYTVNNTNGKDRLLRQSGLHQFPAYAFYQDNRRLGLLNNDLAAGLNSVLMPGFMTRLDVDEPEETILVPSQVRSDLDAVFGAGENATLHLTTQDQTDLGLKGRLRDLAPINFDGNGAEDRRRAFTTTSWDLKSFGKTKYTQTDPQFRSWEFTNQFPPQFGAIAPFSPQDPFRGPVRELLRIVPGNTQQYIQRKLSVNEICDYDTTGRLRFRPLTPHPKDNPNDATDDYLQLQGNSVSQRFQNPMAMPPAPNSPEQLRNHILPPPTMTANSYVDPEAQEWLARRDRQQLCRDIYVLLYTFGNNQDANVTASNVYVQDLDMNGIPDKLEEIAQFAVNLVDRMDPDNIVTKFEYDLNLSDGWNLNDDPFDEDDAGNSTTGESNRGVAYGVEMQEMTLHEGQVVYAKRINDAQKNHNGTQWNDEFNQDFTYVELENISPNIVSFRNQSWQIALEPNVAGAANAAALLALERRLVLNGNAPSVGTGSNSRLLIGTAGVEDITNGAATNPLSHVLLDPAYDPTKTYDPNDPTTYTRIVPRNSLQNANALDLIRQRTAYAVYEKQANPNGYGDGAQINPPPSTIPAGAEWFSITPVDPTQMDFIEEQDDRNLTVKFTLRRRLNPHRTSPAAAASADNPWITVDTLTVPIDVFTLTSSSASSDKIMEQLTGDDPSTAMQTYDKRKFASTERTEPLANVQPGINGNLDRGNHAHNVDVNPAVVIRNSLGQANPNFYGQAVINYQLYQTHPDRDYASIGEILDVPLFRPEQLTERTATGFDEQPGNQHQAGFYKLSLASARFFDQLPTAPGARWHRLFEFLEVPDRSHRNYDSDAWDPINNTYRRPPFVEDLESRFFYRKPGRIQLNTLRHPQVFGGLLDDIEVIQPDNLLTSTDGSGRRWWSEFIQTRDGLDLDPQTVGLFLPGLPVAKPYRNASFSAAGPASRDHTVLRSRPGTPGQQLFEVTGSKDPTLRYRLLDKVLNNSTNRSNVFLVFVQVDFFEAIEQTDGPSGLNVVRVGGKLSDSPKYRGFFVVDRSKILEVLSELKASNQAFNPSLDFLPPASFVDPIDGQPKFNFSFNQDFDYRQLILHRQTIN